MFEKQKAKRWAKLSPDERTCYYLLFQVRHGVSLNECLHNLGYFSKTRYNTPMKIDKELCRDCNGKGKILASTCKHCNGTGYVTIQLTEQLFYCGYCGAPLNGNSVCAKCGRENN